MFALMQALGNPQDAVRIIHIAGTKGKGSTSNFLSNILWKCGYRVGRFTSPHLERLEERFWVCGSDCSERDIVDLIATIRPIVEAMDQTVDASERLTFFEITSAMAFLLFARQAVDFAVVEVGLGGRLDSTNVCHPLVSVITSISRDHTALLGDTLAEIAGEKGGIIKPGIPVVSGVEAPEAHNRISSIALDKDASMFQLGIDFGVQKLSHTPSGDSQPFHQTFAFSWQDEVSETFSISAKGTHQIKNAGVALAVVRLLKEQGFEIGREPIVAGLAETTLPARIECLAETPVVIVDAAHNDASAEALVSVLKEQFPGKQYHLVFASSIDKDHSAIMAHLLPEFQRIWFTRFGNSPRASSPSELRRLAKKVAAIPLKSQQIHSVGDSAKAFGAAVDATGPEDVLVVTGSFFIAAEFKRYWRSRRDAKVSPISIATQ